MMLLDSIKEIYISNNKPKTWEHVQEVAETAIWLAERHSLDSEKVKIAEVVWDFGARDIFVRYHGKEPAFEMLPDRIRLYDFSDNYYEIDYDGKVIRY